MKPGNVMLRPNGDLVLIDFGIAREYKTHNTADTTWLGTQGYAAPEQFGGQGQTDQRTDIYCLGATLYHLLTNHNPSEPPYEMYPIRRWDDTLSSGLEEIILKCTQRNPKDRYQNCNELRYALEHYMEMDAEYRRKENRSFHIFMGLFAATVLSLTAALVFQHYGNRIKNNNYDTYVENAVSTSDEDEAVSLYMEAIRLEPARGEAYLRMLETFMEDDNLEETEAYTLRQILQGMSANSTYEELMKQDAEAYDEFAYQLGMAYFYSYEESGNKNNSKKWLQAAAQSQSLDAHKVQRAQRLLQIAEYYSKIGVQSKSGDESTSYKDYWDDLTALSDGDIVQMDNAVTALMMYNELVFQIATNAPKFENAGVSNQEMVGQIQNVIAHLESDIRETDLQNERVQSLMRKVVSNIKVAERELQTDFSLPETE